MDNFSFQGFPPAGFYGRLFALTCTFPKLNIELIFPGYFCLLHFLFCMHLTHVQLVLSQQQVSCSAVPAIFQPFPWGLPFPSLISAVLPTTGIVLPSMLFYVYMDQDWMNSTAQMWWPGYSSSQMNGVSLKRAKPGKGDLNSLQRVESQEQQLWGQETGFLSQRCH